MDAFRQTVFPSIALMFVVQPLSERPSESPNGPKLSDSGGCAVGERRRQEAGAVTASAVRCSAWLGASFIGLAKNV